MSEFASSKSTPQGPIQRAAEGSAGRHTRLIPAADWNKYHAWPPCGGLRHLIFYAKTNGFDKVIRRVGRRVLVDEQAFFTWVDSQGNAQ